jgi:hypothetical protein
MRLGSPERQGVRVAVERGDQRRGQLPGDGIGTAGSWLGWTPGRREKCDADHRHTVVAGPARMVEDRSRVWQEDRETYYGAFVRNPDGNNVEAVCRLPE